MRLPLGRCLLLFLYQAFGFVELAAQAWVLIPVAFRFVFFLLSRQFFFSHDFFPLYLVDFYCHLYCDTISDTNSIRRRWFCIGLSVVAVEISTIDIITNNQPISLSVRYRYNCVAPTFLEEVTSEQGAVCVVCMFFVCFSCLWNTLGELVHGDAGEDASQTGRQRR